MATSLRTHDDVTAANPSADRAGASSNANTGHAASPERPSREWFS